MFNQLHLDATSFWIGFLAGLFIFWILLLIRTWLPDVSTSLKRRGRLIRQGLTKSAENRLREDIVRHAQHLHLAEALFSLDEIIIEPQLMSPPIGADLDSESVYQDITSELIPDMPEWPELASFYQAPSISLGEALSAGANIAIIGRPGSGKSTALAHLACQLARRALVNETIKEQIPLFAHVFDLSPLTTDTGEIALPLINAIASYASPLTQTRLERFVLNTLETNHALLILDGLDETTIEESTSIIKWITRIQARYPDLQIILSANSDNYFGLTRNGFKPLAIAAWDQRKKNAYFDRWMCLWKEHISSLQSASEIIIDPHLLVNWLKATEHNYSPFEATLAAWAFYSGDILSNEMPGLIECTLRRLTANYPTGYQALERAAVTMILSQRTALSLDEFRNQAPEFEITVPKHDQGLSENMIIESEPATASTTLTRSGKTIPLPGAGSQLISGFINLGILIHQVNSKVRFSHCLFTTFLAGKAFASQGNITAVIGQDSWYGKWHTLGFTSAFGDLTRASSLLLSGYREDILAKNLFQMARWLSWSSKPSAWRSEVLRALASLVQRDYFSEGLAARTLCAIALSKEPAIGKLFQQWTRTDRPNLKWLGALGFGIIRDQKSVPVLEQLMDEIDPKTRRASCLALVAIGTKSALEIVVNALHQGDELIQRAAAESLASSEDGIEILQAHATDEDLMVRRSVVFGYLRSKKPDLLSALERIAMDDPQWVVRNAASNALEVYRQPNFKVPKRGTPVTEIPWLIGFAGKRGIGVQSGKPAQELICQAIEDGDEVEKLLAMEHVRLNGEDFAIEALMRNFFNAQGRIRQAAFDAIVYLSASGARLPNQTQIKLYRQNGL